MPGLTGNLIRANNRKEYETVLSELIENEELRLSLGERTRNKIEEIHTGKGWQLSLETIYKYVASIQPIQVDSSVSDRMSIGEPDIFTQTVCPFNGPDFDKLIIDRVRLMPFHKRFSFWVQEMKKGNIGTSGNSKDSGAGSYIAILFDLLILQYNNIKHLTAQI